MTENEARKKIEACERQITSAHTELKDRARNVGAAAVSAASKKTTISTMLPLILVVIGVFLFTTYWFVAVLLVGGGIFLAYVLHARASEAQEKIENAEKNLRSRIDSNEKI